MRAVNSNPDAVLQTDEMPRRQGREARQIKDFRSARGLLLRERVPATRRLLPIERAVPASCSASARWIGLLLTMLATILGSCAASPSTPSPAIPERVVALAPSLTEVVYGLGEGDRLVGVCAQCDYPEEAKQLPRVGGYLVTERGGGPGACDRTWSSRCRRPGTARRCARSSAPASGCSWPATGRSTISGPRSRAVAEALGVPDRGAAMTSSVAGRSAGASTIGCEGLPPRRVLLVVGHRPLIVAGGGTLQDELVRTAGGVNVAADAGAAFPQVPMELVVARAPDVILDAAMGSEAGGRELFAAFANGAGGARRPDRLRSRRTRSSAPARGWVRRRPCLPRPSIPRPPAPDGSTHARSTPHPAPPGGDLRDADAGPPRVAGCRDADRTRTSEPVDGPRPGRRRDARLRDPLPHPPAARAAGGGRRRCARLLGGVAAGAARESARRPSPPRRVRRRGGGRGDRADGGRRSGVADRSASRVPRRARHGRGGVRGGALRGPHLAVRDPAGRGRVQCARGGGDHAGQRDRQLHAGAGGTVLDHGIAVGAELRPGRGGRAVRARGGGRARSGTRTI